MPVFKRPGEPYNPTPWVKKGLQLAPTPRELAGNPDYGKIPVHTWDDIKGFFSGKKRPEELTPPPVRDRGGTYRTDAILDGLDEPAINDAYNLLLTDLATDRYRVRFRSAAEMERMHGRGAYGFEEGDLIELARDAPSSERLRASAHELGAKRLRERFSYFDHPAQEAAVTAEGNRVLMEYISRALRMKKAA